MISIKSSKDVDLMRKSGEIAGQALKKAGQAIQVGITTAEINQIAHNAIISLGARPAFLGYHGYPSCCNISINDEVIHGLPGKRKICDGDIVSIDVGAIYNEFYSDTASTFTVGNVSEQAVKLVQVTKKCFYDGLQFARQGYRVSDISKAVQLTAEKHGYGVVRDFTGHGVGRELHEDPQIPNFFEETRGARLLRGMTFAIEPMITQGRYEIKVLKDGWTVVTADGKLSAHFEHTVLVTENEPELLTFVGD